MACPLLLAPLRNTTCYRDDHQQTKSAKGLRVEPNEAAVRNSSESVQEAVVGQRPEQDSKVNEAQPAGCQGRPAESIHDDMWFDAVIQKSKV